MLSPIVLGLLLQAPPDPYRLPIGRSGETSVKVGAIVDLRTNAASNLDAIAAAADGTQYVYVGEHHDHPDHHKFQADVIAALVKRGRRVTVGFEMFTRPAQSGLGGWTLGWWDEATFIERSDWKKQWGFDYNLYKPIFDVVKENKLPMVALNVPRDWVRAVGKDGYSALTPEARAELPAEFDVTNKNHKSIFEALMGGHPMTGPRADNVYAAQVLWDEGMGDTAIKAMRGKSANHVMVVVAGIGHVMYGQGINWRVAKRTGDKGITAVAVEAKDQAIVSRGIGDFVYVAPELERKPAGG